MPRPADKFMYLRIGFLLISLSPFSIDAQETYCYPLTENTEAVADGVPPLTILVNGNGQPGRFRSIVAPSNWCSELGIANVFEFEDNVGLAFDNSSGFIDCAYTVEFVVNFYELPQNTLFDAPWIWLFGTSNEDDGIFLHRNALFNIRALEFWDDNDRLRSVAFPNMNTEDRFHYTITRDCDGLVSVYINCQLFTTFNDTRNILSLRPETGNRMIFFQDDPGTLSSETSPGLVSNIRISNYVRSESNVLASCYCICESLTSDCDIAVTIEETTCDSTEVGTVVEEIPYDSPCGCACDSTITRIVTLLPADSCELICQINLTTDTTLCAGIPFMGNVLEGDTTICQQITGIECDTARCYNITVLPAFETDMQATICAGELFALGDSMYNATGIYQQRLTSTAGCDSIITLDLTVAEPDDIRIDTTLCAGSTIAGVTVMNDTTICQTYQNSLGCDSTVCYFIHIVSMTETTISASICPGETYAFAGQDYAMPGTYTATSTATSGCDSLVTLNLAFIEPVEEQRDTAICRGDSFLGNLIVRDTAICQNLQTARGCDSTICYNILALQPQSLELTERICEGESYSLGDTAYTEPGTYTATFQSAAGCDSTVVLNLTVDSIPVTYIDVPVCRDSMFDGVLFTQDTVICQTLARPNACDSTICLNIRLLDPPQSTLEAAICPNEVFVFQDSVYTEPGTYQYRFSQLNGCDSIVTITLTERPTQPLTIAGDSLLCVGDSAWLDAGADFSSYEWSVSGETQQQLRIDAPGTYAVTTTDFQGCTYEGEIRVAPAPEPSVKISTVQPLSCPGAADAALLAEASGGLAPYRFTWEDGTDSAAIESLGAGSYAVTVTDTRGCEAEATAEVSEPPDFEIAIDTQPPSCSSLSDGIISIEATGVTGPFLYTLNDRPFQNTNTFSNLSAGEYEIRVQDINGCEQSRTVLLEVPAPFTLAVEPEVTAIFAGDSVTLQVISDAETLEQYTWSPAISLNCATCPRVIAAPVATTVYTVTATDASGCSVTATGTVKVAPKGKEAFQVFVPTAFSPDGDGINDRLYVFGGPEVEMIEIFQVFDRWGNLVYERNHFLPNDESTGWDGKINGSLLSANVYAWLAKINYKNGKKTVLSGHVSLVK